MLTRSVGGRCTVVALSWAFCGIIRNPSTDVLELQLSLNGWPVAFMGWGHLLSPSDPVNLLEKKSLYITSDLFPLMGRAVTFVCPAVTCSLFPIQCPLFPILLAMGSSSRSLSPVDFAGANQMC